MECLNTSAGGAADTCDTSYRAAIDFEAWERDHRVITEVGW